MEGGRPYAGWEELRCQALQDFLAQLLCLAEKFLVFDKDPVQASGWSALSVWRSIMSRTCTGFGKVASSVNSSRAVEGL